MQNQGDSRRAASGAAKPDQLTFRDALWVLCVFGGPWRPLFAVLAWPHLRLQRMRREYIAQRYGE